VSDKLFPLLYVYQLPEPLVLVQVKEVAPGASMLADTAVEDTAWLVPRVYYIIIFVIKIWVEYKLIIVIVYIWSPANTIIITISRNDI
jgi:hypothetical protein